MLAQQQLNAYNAYDLEAFLKPYADDALISFNLRGKDKMRRAYAFITKTPGLYCRLLNRTIRGNRVIDHEEVLGAAKNLCMP